MSTDFDFNKTRYTHRDYESLKQDLINAIPSLTQKWTSTEESDPGIVLIKLMSMLGDNLSYNMDKMALEAYKDSVTQRKNCAKILSLLGYKMHWYRSARVTATVKNLISEDSDGTGSLFILRPFESTFTAGNLTYTMFDMDYPASPVLVRTTDTFKEINLIEGEVSAVRFTKQNLQGNRYYLGTETQVDETSLLLYVNNALRGKLVDNLYLVTDDYYVSFEFNIDEYDRPYIELINYWESLVGENAEFTLRFVKSKGSQGNVTANAFDYLRGENGSYLYITNEANTSLNPEAPFNSPGKDPQTPEDARQESANYVFTYDTLVSPSDFEKAVRRVSKVVNSKLVDGRIIDLDNTLTTAEIINRYNDSFSSLVDGSGNLLPYIAIMYMIGKAFEYNAYDTHNLGNKFYETYDPDSQGWVEYSTNKPYFPYKLVNDSLSDVDQYINDIKVMNVDLYYGTTKVYPFKVNGVLHFVEPLSPTDIVYIVDTLINDSLEKSFNPELKEYGVKPDVIDVVNTVQNSDSRIKYFDSSDTTPISWWWMSDASSGTFTDPGTIDSTSFCKYQGLGDSFNIDVKFRSFSITNISGDSFELSAPQSGGVIVDGYEGIPDDLTPMMLSAGETAKITCSNIKQIRTLAYWIQDNKIVYNDRSEF